jgi:hypothetical protein
MTTEPEQILAEISALLAELPDTAADNADLTDVDLDAIAARLEEAHEVLVRALESVEKGPGGSAGGTARLRETTPGPETPGMDG